MDAVATCAVRRRADPVRCLLLVPALGLAACVHTQRLGDVDRHFVLGGGVVECPVPERGRHAAAAAVRAVGIHLGTFPRLAVTIGYTDRLTTAVDPGVPGVVAETTRRHAGQRLETVGEFVPPSSSTEDPP